MDIDSWKIEQNGEIKCSKNDRGPGVFDVNKPTIDIPCCVDLTQDYTLTCSSVNVFGFDYMSYKYGMPYDIALDGFILINSKKYCDTFEVEEVVTIPGISGN